MPIVLLDHDAGWAARFEAEAAALLGALGPAALEIHHIGSTAVEGLLAKPIVDVLLVATAIESVDARRPALEALGFRWRGENGIPGRRYLDRAGTHVHAFERGHAEIARHLRFRDALSASPTLRDAYAALKRSLRARDPDDREGYQAGKAPFIEAVLEAAPRRGSPP